MDAAPFFNLELGDIHLLFTTGAGSSDREWNLVSLDSRLYDWWRRFYFGFKCLGVTESFTGTGDAIATLNIQIHWMPRNFNDEHLTTEKRTVQSWTNQFTTSYGDPTTNNPLYAITRPSNGHIVKTGDLFYIHIQENKVEEMEHTFAVRWAITRIVAMAGGVEVLATDRTPDYFAGERSLQDIYLERLEEVPEHRFEPDSDSDLNSDSDVEIPDSGRR